MDALSLSLSTLSESKPKAVDATADVVADVVGANSSVILLFTIF